MVGYGGVEGVTGRVVRCWIAVLAVLALAGSACGSDNDEGQFPAEAPSAAPEASAVDAEPEVPEGIDAEPQAPEGADAEVQASSGDDGQVELPADAETAADRPVLSDVDGVDDEGSSLDAGFVVLGELPAEVSMAASGGEVAVSWSVAAAVEGSSRAGYEVQWRSGDQDWDADRRVVVVGLSFVIRGLEDGAMYAVRVRPAAVQTAIAQGASITAGAGSEPVAEVVSDAPALDSDVYESVSAPSGAVSFEMAGEPVWPATIEIPVDVDRLGDEVPVLMYFNEALRSWVPAPSAVFDSDRGVVVAEVYHLSWWIVVFVKRAILGSDAAREFVDEWWDDSTNWLRTGWSSAQKFLLRDIPALAGAVLDKSDDVGATIARGAREVLLAARDVSATALEFLAALFKSIFSLDIDRPVCSGPSPDWVAQIELKGRANNALYWCGEDDGFGRLELKLTVNRGYSMVLENNTSMFGPFSPENITVVESEVPEQLSDFVTSKLYDLLAPSDIVFLPSGATTTLLVPLGALRGYDRLDLGYYAEQIAWLMDIIVALFSALTAMDPSLIRSLADKGWTIIECAWGFLSTNRDASWFDKIVVITESCILPSIPHMTKNLVIKGIAAVATGSVLLYNGVRMLLDGTITRGNQIFIDRDPTVTTTTTAPPTTTAPSTTGTTPTATDVELNPAMDGGGVVSSGFYHSCGLTANGAITCWGLLHYGGTGGQPPHVEQRGADDPAGSFSSVASGGFHSCGLRTDQTITCWLYHPSSGSQYGQADAPAGAFTAVSTGAFHSCGLRTDLTITCWGDDRGGQTDAPVGEFTSVSTGNFHACALGADRTVQCWPDRYEPGAIPTGELTQVSVGDLHSCALRVDRTITCWGWDGDGTGKLDAPSGTFSAVSVGLDYSCGLRTGKTITCWGDNSVGQTDAPAGQFIAISTSEWYSCGLRNDRAIICWGENVNGRTIAPSGQFGPG